MFYTFVWTNPDYSLDNQVPLKLLSDSVCQTGTKNRQLNIVFLEGMQYVKDEYIESLENPNVKVIDYESRFKEIKLAYSKIFAHYSVFESYCFLRWICMAELVAETGLEQMWHIDSDVILHVSLDAIAADTKGKAFMLEGCPVLTSITHHSWFTIYKKNLQELIEDPVLYSERAYQHRNTYRKLDKLLCNQSNYRNPLGSDQDLLQYLIGSGTLPQENAETIFSDGYYYIQNPLQLNDWCSFQGSVHSGSFHSCNGVVIVNEERQMAFTHFQGNFSTYCNVFYFLHRLKAPGKVMRLFLRFSIKNEMFSTNKFFYLLRVFLNRSGIALSRSKLAEHFIKDEQYLLIKVLNFLAQRKNV